MRKENNVVTIGSFDGVHIGHLAIIDALKEKSKEIGGETVVVTFSPHPRIVLGHDADNLFFLNSDQEKECLLKQLGIDNIVVLPFTQELAALTMEAFLVNYIKNTLHAKVLVVGYNHRFGSDRISDYDTLCNIAKREGIEIVRVDKKGIDERDVSSTTIRNLLKRGDLKRVNSYLSHPYFFMGNIDRTGQLLYFHPKKLYPPSGTYSVIVESKNLKIETTAEVTKLNSIIINGISEAIEQATVYFV